jgi:hypothetical protein
MGIYMTDEIKLVYHYFIKGNNIGNYGDYIKGMPLDVYDWHHCLSGYYRIVKKYKNDRI